MVTPGSKAHEIYGDIRIDEAFFCNYELNPDYRKQLESSGISVTGETSEGSTRIVEMADHPFYIGTGFVSQLSSTEEKPHPIVMAFLKAAAERVQ